MYDYYEYVEEYNPQIKNWIHTSDFDHQGDWFSVGWNDKGYYFIQGTFGSCSMCDWLSSLLEDGGNEEEWDEFKKTLQKLAFMGKSKELALQYIEKEFSNYWDSAESALKRLYSKLKE